ncbi:ATP-dependent Clp protease proteolytic subunit [Defluviimonas sp. WL0024]|uniref:ATP-dependent Clp protease proteolytic subunit n=1 Tax=Albidovulum salinarum TaxID=2984153 RepID=A0ABT2X3C0_9RHOB|nr:ATP-dependent Clp protease proteolytic subunit [Defluviimonas sp. WL0024]MCU9848209.1 ATP-dependent Clp protease proteolytic subunit [Defluviimonas sp. WL0024]
MSFSITDALWLFLILSALQPMIARKITDMRRLAMISQIEKQRGSRVILMVHRQETMRLLGFPLVRYIDIQDSEDVLRAIRMTDDDMPLDIVLHTPGGLVLAALQIARAVEAHKGKVTVFVPHHAMSGGTLIALAADEIVMCEHSVLGPIDPQIGQYPAASILSAVERKPVAEVDDATLILADVARKALDQVIGAATALLSVRMPKEKAAALAGTLASGTWTHDYPIAAAEAAALGLPVTTAMPEEVLTLMTLYPQPVRQSGGVEYLPVPRERPARAPKS